MSTWQGLGSEHREGREGGDRAQGSLETSRQGLDQGIGKVSTRVPETGRNNDRQAQ